MSRIDAKSFNLLPSLVHFEKPLSAPSSTLLTLLSHLHLTHLTRLEKNKTKGPIVSATNLTLLNVVLLWKGPMREERLTKWLVGIQVAGSVLAFGVSMGLLGLFMMGIDDSTVVLGGGFFPASVSQPTIQYDLLRYLVNTCGASANGSQSPFRTSQKAQAKRVLQLRLLRS